jgi:hypothetical protein
MRVLPRLRLLLARRPWVRWLVVALCAAVVALQLLAAQGALERERQRWGTPRTVWVAEARTPAGGPLAARSVEWPEAIVPADAVGQLPASPVAAREVFEGQVVIGADIAGDRTVPSGWAVFAVPVDGLPALAPGAAVAAFTGGTLLCAGRVAPGTGDPTVAEVAVPHDCAPGVAAALANGELVLARVA